MLITSGGLRKENLRRLRVYCVRP